MRARAADQERVLLDDPEARRRLPRARDGAAPADGPRDVDGALRRRRDARRARQRVERAVRSPKRSFRAGPTTVAALTLPLLASMAAPSSTSQVTTQSPSAAKVASKKGLPASTPLLLHQSVAVVTPSPTTRPPTSRLGQSSLSQSATVRSRYGGMTQAKSMAAMLRRGRCVVVLSDDDLGEAS